MPGQYNSFPLKRSLSPHFRADRDGGLSLCTSRLPQHLCCGKREVLKDMMKADLDSGLKAARQSGNHLPIQFRLVDQGILLKGDLTLL